MREYKTIPEFSRYSVDRGGRVYDIKNEREVSQVKTGVPEYLYVNMHDDAGKRKLVRVHRCVALAWIALPDSAPPNNYEMVDHIDRNPFNNHADNLRWVDRSGNARNTSINLTYEDGQLLIDKLRDLVGGVSAGDPLYGRAVHDFHKNKDLTQTVLEHFGYLKYGIKANSFNEVVETDDGRTIYLIQLVDGDREKYKSTLKNIRKGWPLWNALHDIPVKYPDSVCVSPDINGVGYWWVNRSALLAEISKRVGEKVGGERFETLKNKYGLHYVVTQWTPRDDKNIHTITHNGESHTGTKEEISDITGLTVGQVEWRVRYPDGKGSARRIRNYVFNGDQVTRKWIISYFQLSNNKAGKKIGPGKMSLVEFLESEGVDLTGYNIEPIIIGE